jgi:hypothetical protein
MAPPEAFTIAPEARLRGFAPRFTARPVTPAARFFLRGFEPPPAAFFRPAAIRARNFRFASPVSFAIARPFRGSMTVAVVCPLYVGSRCATKPRQNFRMADASSGAVTSAESIPFVTRQRFATPPAFRPPLHLQSLT